VQRTLILCLLVVGAAVALVIGAYSALADSGPASSVAGIVISADGRDDLQDAGGDSGDDVDGEDGDGPQAKGARHIAGLIDDAFGAEEGSAWALHEKGIGFGALFKLHALAAVMDDTSVEELLDTIPTDEDGEYEFGFGKLRKALSEEQQAIYESGPKNLGQLVSASRRPEHVGPDSDGPPAAGLGKAREEFAAHASNGHGPPDHAPAHGRR
jgi:hypothetical protein